jgi:cysteine dioxygenase
MVSRSEWYEMLAICWRRNHTSPIHDHAGSSCAFKIVEGLARETIFKLTGPGRVRATGEQVFQQGEICASTNDHIHQVSNGSGDGSDLITLHIYSPPLHMGLYRVDPIIETNSELNPA